MAASSMLLLRLAEFLRARRLAISSDAVAGAVQDRKSPPNPDEKSGDFPWEDRVPLLVQAAADALLAKAAAPEPANPSRAKKRDQTPVESIQTVLSEAWLVRNSFFRALNRFQGEQSGKKVDFTALDMTETRQEAVQEFDRLISRALSEWIAGEKRASSVPATAVKELFDGMRAIQGLLQLASDLIPAGAKAHVSAAAQQLGRLATRAEELTQPPAEGEKPSASAGPATPPPPPRANLALAPLDIPSFVRTVADSSRPAAQRKGLRLECLVNPGPQVLKTDGAKLHRAVTLLLNFAMSLTEKGEVSMVSDFNHSGAWTIEIRDTSPGIPPELLAKLLRGVAHAPDTAPTEDATLGVALARDLALLLGGTLDATSEPGEGNCFTITLPVTT